MSSHRRSLGAEVLLVVAPIIVGELLLTARHRPS